MTTKLVAQVSFEFFFSKIRDTSLTTFAWTLQRIFSFKCAALNSGVSPKLSFALEVLQL